MAALELPVVLFGFLLISITSPKVAMGLLRLVMPLVVIGVVVLLFSGTARSLVGLYHLGPAIRQPGLTHHHAHTHVRHRLWHRHQHHHRCSTRPQSSGPRSGEERNHGTSTLRFVTLCVL
jgi:hypothetical protein